MNGVEQEEWFHQFNIMYTYIECYYICHVLVSDAILIIMFLWMVDYYCGGTVN